MSRRAVFLDKDGTLLENVPYNCDPGQMRLTPGAGAALARLQSLGFTLVVVSNQSGIARGYFGVDRLSAIEQRVQELVAPWGARIDAFYWCPHHPEGAVDEYRVECLCRKPAPGMLLRAANDLDIDLAASWMVGDILDDVEAGNRAGCSSLLLDCGNETEWRSGPFRVPYQLVRTLGDAAEVIARKVTEPGVVAEVSR